MLTFSLRVMREHAQQQSPHPPTRQFFTPPIMEVDLDLLARRLGECLSDRGLMLATAESCTGGWIAQAITAIEGSSAWFERGFVTYSNESKVEMLGVTPASLAREGAVSKAVAREMVEGALEHSYADIAVAVTGIAGPTGGSETKPVGTVYIAWKLKQHDPIVALHHFPGDREAVRQKTVEVALEKLVSLIR